MKPKKSLGQNFLISPRIVDMIVHHAEIKSGETILEIGPGKGMLTDVLLRTGAKVIAIEKDEMLVKHLEDRFIREIDAEKLKLITGDVLEMDFEKLGIRNWKLVANIPYYITGAILEKFLEREYPPELCVLMVQKEVAERIVARNKKESILSISVKIFGTPKIVMRVARGNFFPIPNVDSAVLAIEHIKNPFASAKEKNNFFKIVKAGFSHKRKKLISNLPKEILSEAKQVFSEMKISENIRAEDLELSQWLALARKLETAAVIENWIS